MCIVMHIYKFFKSDTISDDAEFINLFFRALSMLRASYFGYKYAVMYYAKKIVLSGSSRILIKNFIEGKFTKSLLIFNSQKDFSSVASSHDGAITRLHEQKTDLNKDDVLKFRNKSYGVFLTS